MQYDYTKDLRRAYMGQAPTLAHVRNAFGDNTAETWLEIQLNNLSEFSGCKDKLTNAQIEEIAKVILATWPYLKVTEMMHFFLQFKSGKYGKFFGAVDGLVITEALQVFAKERHDLVVKYVQEEEQKQTEQEQRDLIRARQFKAALGVCHMDVQEWLRAPSLHDLTMEELSEVGWLYRQGYEPQKTQQKQTADETN